ncbi:hypothetical protein LSH36_771g00016 [Paralvinella palmiformis]|uniref:Uncharacterized protein n=1 Tax=Paralvinella palmiformis TaxID=53620 RepID=A0AAD9J1L6_9ANNE|nr:hypothetical protein LSH36_771g00016 [Paralvinella palmiformis]
MPQSNTGNWRVKDIPYGKGSVHAQTLEASFRHWRRAVRINEAENYKHYMATSVMEKHHKAAENRKEMIIQRLRRTLEELEAYKKVLESYRASNLRTLQWGYKIQPCATPRTCQRQKLERRIYDCGFSIETLKAEVRQIMDANKLEVRRSFAHQSLLEVARHRSNFTINRRLTNRAMANERRTVEVHLPPVPRQRSVIQASKQLLATLDK